MRLFLLPISTRRTLIFCESRAAQSAALRPWYTLDRMVYKANATWADWEKNGDSILDWKRRTTTYGNTLFRRIPYEEWGLKSIPNKERKSGRLKGPNDTAPATDEKVQILVPGLYQGFCKEGIFDTIKRMANERQPLHRKRMWYSIVGMPLTAPIGILPVIPNIPFFYLCFRAYSHWKALRGSQHLSQLLSASSLEPKPSTALDNLYTAGLLYPTRAASRNAPDPTLDQSKAVVEMLRQQTSPNQTTAKESSKRSEHTQAAAPEKQPVLPNNANIKPGYGKKLLTGEEEVMLLQGWNGKLIAERFKLPALEIEIERAVEQVQQSIHKGEGELLGEKKELEDLTRKFREKQHSA